MKGLSLAHSQKGQGMTEYILIVALIALFVIAGVKFFSKKTEQGFKDAGNAVSGEVNKAIKHGGKN